MKRKRIIAASLAAVLMLALTACSGDNETKQEPTSVSSESSAAEDVSSESEETSKPEATDGSDATQELTQESDASSEMSASGGEADISSAIDGSTATEESPIPLGQWAAIADYSAEDETYHNVYVRVTKVTTSTEDASYVQNAVDQNNANGSYYQIDLSSEDYQVPSDVEWCVLDYEVYVPGDYPSPEYGITEPTMNFSENNIGGGGIPSADGTSVYLALGTNNFDLQNNPSDMRFSVGNTYSFQILFTMVKGYENYLFELSSYPDGTHSDNTSADIMYYAYFANK